MKRALTFISISTLAAAFLALTGYGARAASETVIVPAKTATLDQESPLKVYRAHLTAVPGVNEDVVMKAMCDELERSMDRLKLDKYSGPYYLDYTIDEHDTFKVAASFGALTNRSRDLYRSLSIDAREGNYSLDNSGFGHGGINFGGMFGHSGHFGNSMTTDNDYAPIRRMIWLQTDSDYKRAIENLEAKKAYLEQHIVKDRPDDMSQEVPVVDLDKTEKLTIDENAWVDNVKKLSEIFRSYPKIRGSQITFSGDLTNSWYANNEGFLDRGCKKAYELIAVASAETEDGHTVSDSEMYAAEKESQMPSYETMEAGVKSLADRVVKLAQAPNAEDYRGPILLEGSASAEFFTQTLGPHLGGPRESLGTPFFSSGNQLKDEIGHRILPKFISIVDDPTAKDYKGTPLVGGWEIDDDGMRAQKVTLVENGIFKTFCMSRAPNRYVKHSNGHSVGGTGEPSILFVNSSNVSTTDQLRKDLIQMGKDNGQKYVLIARKLAGGSLLAMDPMSYVADMFSSFAGGGGAVVTPPVLLYKVYVDDGHEELVRGAQFSRLTLRVLRDIDSTGDDAAAYVVAHGGHSASIVAPSLLIKEVELKHPEKEAEKLPVLPHPYFSK